MGSSAKIQSSDVVENASEVSPLAQLKRGDFPDDSIEGLSKTSADFQFLFLRLHDVARYSARQ
jgi:hypothetical protein